MNGAGNKFLTVGSPSRFTVFYPDRYIETKRQTDRQTCKENGAALKEH